MTSILLGLVCVGAPPMVPEVQLPPLPDFVTPVDYVAWYRQQLAFAAADNAYEEYRLFMEGGMKPDLPDELQTDISSLLLVPRRWHAGQNPAFAEWLGELPLAVQAFRDGTRRRYFAHPVNGAPKRLLDVEHSDILVARLMSEVSLVEAWRLDTEMTPDQFVERISEVSRFAQHMTQGLTLIEQLTAMSVNNRIYVHLASIVRMGALDDLQLKALLAHLQAYDAVPAAKLLVRALPMELAMVLEMLQGQCLDETGAVHSKFSTRPEAMQLWEFMAKQQGTTLEPTELEACDPVQLARDLQAYVQGVTTQLQEGVGVGDAQRSAVESLRELATRSKPARLLVPHLERAMDTALRTEIGRRGTQALVALAIRRLQDRQWPDTIQAAEGLVPAEMLIDICSGAPLRYNKTSPRQMMLYSVGRDGQDNGGYMTGLRYNGRTGEDVRIYPPKTE